MVPELEEREAAVYTLVPWERWAELHWWDRSCAVAHYRTHLLIDMHMYDAQKQEAAANAPPVTAPYR